MKSLAPTARLNRAPTLQDRQRHKDMLSAVFAWMNRTGGTQQLLVRCIQDFWKRRGDGDYRCDHTLLSRILNPDHSYVPTPRRPQSMRILQAAMVICTADQDPNVVAPAADGDTAWASDEEHAFKVHRARLRHLREQGRTTLFESLHRLGELCAVARWMDDTAASNDLGETMRQRAVENTLLTIAALADPGNGAAAAPTGRAPQGAAALEAPLTAQGVDPGEARRLVAEQVRRVDALLSATARCEVNMRAYAGAALFHCGQRQRGMAMLLEAVALSCDAARRHDPHWETLLELLERLLARGDAQAEAWSQQAGQMAQRQQSPQGLPGAARLLEQAWGMVNAPRVRQHWLTVAPSAVARIEAGPPASAASPPTLARSTSSPRLKLGGLPALAAAALVAGALVLAACPRPGNAAQVVPPAHTTSIGLNAVPFPHSADRATIQLAIRGREAQRPSPPPNPPPGNGDDGPSTT